MATKAEQAHADAQRTGEKKRTKAASAKKTAKAARTSKGGKVEAKATVALEPRAADGRASRKSTRSSANRAKAASPYEIREGLQKGTPDAKARKARAQATKVRGH